MQYYQLSKPATTYLPTNNASTHSDTIKNIEHETKFFCSRIRPAVRLLIQLNNYTFPVNLGI
jgi:hypothetical protein